MARSSRASRARDDLLSRGTGITRSIKFEPQRTGATQSSKTMSILVWGKKRRNANNDGVVRTVSPIERRRTTNTRRTADQSQGADARGCGLALSDFSVKTKCRVPGDA